MGVPGGFMPRRRGIPWDLVRSRLIQGHWCRCSGGHGGFEDDGFAGIAQGLQRHPDLMPGVVVRSGELVEQQQVAGVGGGVFGGLDQRRVAGYP